MVNGRSIQNGSKQAECGCFTLVHGRRSVSRLSPRWWLGAQAPLPNLTTLNSALKQPNTKQYQQPRGVENMPSIGPSLPPHVAKRSRDEDGGSSSPESSEKRQRVLGPAAPPRVAGPTLPPASSARSSSLESDSGPGPTPPTKPTRVIGPSAPPAPLNERPPNPPSDDDSDSSDDEFGPAPPPPGASYNNSIDDGGAAPVVSVFDKDPKYTEEAAKPKRDDWMTMPPTQDDLAARMDPTKMRPRKFNTGKSARGGAAGGDGMGVWTETPEQKLKRLQNEALGVSAPPNTEPAAKSSRRSKEEEEKARRIKQKLDEARGKSLMEQHEESGKGKEKEDDPSQRGFDWEKDMGGGMKIGSKQRNDLLKKSKGFGDRFSSGSFL